MSLGRRNLGAVSEKPKVSEKAGKHTEEERSSGRGAGPGSTSARNQILQVTFVNQSVKSHVSNPHLCHFLFSYDILILKETLPNI